MDGILLLLVFFIFGSPFVNKSGIQVNLPTSNLAHKSKNTHIITVIDGSPPKIFFNESRVDQIQLESKLQAGKSITNQVTVLADRSSDYGSVMEVAIIALNYNYDVAFGTQPTSE